MSGLLTEEAECIHEVGTPPSVTLVSVIVLTHNEEGNLPACLESLRRLPCVVFVVDSGSSDQTLEIAERYSAVTRHHEFENYAVQRNWALDNLPIETPWVLNLDADERLTPELLEEMRNVLEQPPPNVSGFLLRRRTIFMGRWIRHGGHYPSYHLRLFRKGSGRCEARRYDQHFVTNGRVERLRHDYLDVVSSSLLTWSLRHGRWAALEANELLFPQAGGKQVTPDVMGNPIQRRRWWRNLYGRGPLFTQSSRVLGISVRLQAGLP